MHSFKVLSFALAATLATQTLVVRAEESNFEASRRFMLANISPIDGIAGSVIASPSKSNPDYYFHWVRDSALVMNVVRHFAELSTNSREKDRYTQILWDYSAFSHQNQNTPNRSGAALSSGLGEPKFNVDGTPFNEDWGRPQTDGPALRALTLIRFARSLLAQTDGKLVVQSKLYHNVWPADTVIKNDLEYISHRWREPAYDIWEEFKAEHFYTWLVQRRALLEGAELADLMDDPAAAGWYRLQAGFIEQELQRFFNPTEGYIRAMLNYKQGTPEKRKLDGLDSAVVLAVLHAQGDDDFFGVDDDRVLATASVLEQAFTGLYAINAKDQTPDGSKMAPGIGRYLLDQYDGVSTEGHGNPWFISTNAFAELHYRLAAVLERKGNVKITPLNQKFFKTALEKTGHSAKWFPGLAPLVMKETDQRFPELLIALRERGDQFMRRSTFHSGHQGAMSEQINRDTGIMQGANDLTWSYASYITATWAR